MSDAKKPTKKKASARGLGRGLSALMADVSVPMTTDAAADIAPSKAEIKPETKIETGTTPPALTEAVETPDPSSKQIQFISISRLERNPDQPRKIFNETDMAELTNSIRHKGVLQPILVRPIPESTRSKTTNSKADYQIVAGERRWQASLKAGLDAMPVLIRELSDQEVLEIGVVENVQRADLNPMEEANAYAQLGQEFGLTQEAIAKKVGKNRASVANRLRLLKLSRPI